MKIGFDTSALDPEFKQHAGRGIGRYVQELVRALKGSSEPNLELLWFDHREVRGDSLARKLIQLSPIGKQTLERQLLYPFSLGRGRTGSCDYLHFPAHMDASAWSPVPYILTVLDLIPLVCADLYRAERPGLRFRFARWLELKSIERAAFILAISECTARDLERVLGIPRSKILVTPLGVDSVWFQKTAPDPGLRARLGIPADRPLLLYVGGIDPRKNWRGMLSTMKLLRERHPDLCLVMAGRIQSDYQFPKLSAAISESGLDTAVCLPGFVSDEDLRRLFAESTAFFFPSLYEGFGLPPLEAMAAGLPVISSDRSSMPEILGHAGRLVNPEDTDACAAAIAEVLADPELRNALSARGREQARKFTWEQTRELTVSAYRKLAGESSATVERAA